MNPTRTISRNLCQLLLLLAPQDDFVYTRPSALFAFCSKSLFPTVLSVPAPDAISQKVHRTRLGISEQDCLLVCLETLEGQQRHGQQRGSSTWA